MFDAFFHDDNGVCPSLLGVQCGFLRNPKSKHWRDVHFELADHQVRFGWQSAENGNAFVFLGEAAFGGWPVLLFAHVTSVSVELTASGHQNREHEGYEGAFVLHSMNGYSRFAFLGSLLSRATDCEGGVCAASRN